MVLPLIGAALGAIPSAISGITSFFQQPQVKQVTLPALGAATAVAGAYGAVRAAPRIKKALGFGKGAEIQPRKRRFIIRNGRKMKWNTKYHGYLPVSRGRRMSRATKLRNYAALVGAGVNAGQAALMVGV